MSWIHALRERAADLFESRRRERELGEEIRYHLEIETQKQIANGLDETSARTLAQRRFGNAESVREATREVRGGQLFSGSMQDVIWSIRSLRKHPGFTFLSLATLALGIGATTTAFAALDTVLLKPLPYRDADRLVVLEELTVKQSVLPPSYPNFVDWRDQNRTFESVASEMYPFSATVKVGNERQLATIMGVSRGFFATIGMTPMLGREFTAEENRIGGAKAVMVSYEFWKTSLGAPNSIDGLKIDDDPIVGVLPRGFRLVGDAQLFFPHEHIPGTTRSAHNYVVVARLKAGATIESGRADMTALSKRLKTQFGDETQAVNVKITPLHDYLFGSFRTLTITVFVAAALVLLVACTNLVSAQLARGFARARELSLRTALGATRGRLVRQLLIESGLLALVGAMAGTLVAVGLTHLVRTL